ncbi:AraC family transcriptional regulator [uncultured Tateyamaria sp.]|uniref:helix-turn-helix domain-containing protein n=1 Tax=uncultured Tateyamaria sp. TaxID=455651 RepID=UPI0026330775|nr:AraC family transcriptional regulator [uncultured Tateyamaria sp.]
MIQHTDGMIHVPGMVDHTLLYHINGGVVHRYEGRRQTGLSDKLRTSSLQPAYQDNGWDMPDNVDVLHLCIDDKDLRHFATSEFGFDVGRLEMRDHMCVNDKFMHHLAPLVLQELQSDLPQTHLMLDGFDSVVAGHMLRAYSNMSDIVVATEARESKHRDKELVKAIRDLVLDKLEENMTANEIGQILNVSPFRLMRLFKNEMGISLHQFVLQNRVAYVRDQLKHSDTPLVDLAYDAGFSSQPHMNASYTKIMGISPGRHRKQLRN